MIGERNAAVEAWARASLAAIDEACPLSGDDWLLTADVMSAWQDARRAYEVSLAGGDPNGS